MGWKYEDLKESGIDPHDLMCKCGHSGDDHHAVYWPLGMTMDECEAYGCNETGGMKSTWQGRFFYRFSPPGYPKYNHDADGKVIFPGIWPKQRFHHFLRRLPLLRGPWYKDHCHHFEEAT